MNDAIAIGDAIKGGHEVQPVQHGQRVFAGRGNGRFDACLSYLFQEGYPARHDLFGRHILDQLRVIAIFTIHHFLHLRFRHRAALEQVQKRVASSNAAQVRVVLLV